MLAFPNKKRKSHNVEKDLLIMSTLHGLIMEHKKNEGHPTDKYVKAKKRLYGMLGVLDYMPK